MFWRSCSALKKNATANCDNPEINTTVESNRPWLNGSPEPMKLLTFADVASALVLKDWEEFAIDAGIAGVCRERGYVVPSAEDDN